MGNASAADGGEARRMECTACEKDWRTLRRKSQDLILMKYLEEIATLPREEKHLLVQCRHELQKIESDSAGDSLRFTRQKRS